MPGTRVVSLEVRGLSGTIVVTKVREVLPNQTTKTVKDGVVTVSSFQDSDVSS